MADFIITDFALLLMDGAKLCSMMRCIGHREIVAHDMVMRVSEPAPGKFLSAVKFLNIDTRFLIIIEQSVKGRI